MKLICSDHFVYTHIQWETTLQYNVVSLAGPICKLIPDMIHKVWYVVYRIHVACDDCRLMFIPYMIY